MTGATPPHCCLRRAAKRLAGRGNPRFSRSVLPSYAVRNSPRRCNSGITSVGEILQSVRQRLRHDVEAVGCAAAIPLLQRVGDIGRRCRPRRGGRARRRRACRAGGSSGSPAAPAPSPPSGGPAGCRSTARRASARRANSPSGRCCKCPAAPPRRSADGSAPATPRTLLRLGAALRHHRQHARHDLDAVRRAAALRRPFLQVLVERARRCRDSAAP